MQSSVKSVKGEEIYLTQIKCYACCITLLPLCKGIFFFRVAVEHEFCVPKSYFASAWHKLKFNQILALIQNTTFNQPPLRRVSSTHQNISGVNNWTE